MEGRCSTANPQQKVRHRKDSLARIEREGAVSRSYMIAGSRQTRVPRVRPCVASCFRLRRSARPGNAPRRSQNGDVPQIERLARRFPATEAKVESSRSAAAISPSASRSTTRRKWSLAERPACPRACEPSARNLRGDRDALADRAPGGASRNAGESAHGRRSRDRRDFARARRHFG